MKKTLGIVIALIGVAATTVALGANENPIIALRQRLMAADGQAAALAGRLADEQSMAWQLIDRQRAAADLRGHRRCRHHIQLAQCRLHDGQDPPRLSLNRSRSARQQA